MNILITGYDGFIGKNLYSHLNLLEDIDLILANRHNYKNVIDKFVSKIDYVFHLAGENRSNKEEEFINNNVHNTSYLINALKKNKNKAPIVFSSSSQSGQNTIYGKTKYQAEQLLVKHSKDNKSQVFIFKFPNIFGKWAKPDFNSVIATIINDLLNNKKTEIWNGDKNFELLYIDNVISLMLECIKNKNTKLIYIEDFVTIKTKVNDIYNTLKLFHTNRKKEEFRLNFNAFEKALYATYLSYLDIEESIFSVNSFSDNRGSFIEFMKEPFKGQISVFTAYPGVIRGNHFHHTKVERFLIFSGTALFKFKHIINFKIFEVVVKANDPKIIETFPGWNHSIENIGTSEFSGVIWANEVFDPIKPDTYYERI